MKNIFQKSMIHDIDLRRLGIAEKRVSEVEDRVIEITQTKKQKYVTVSATVILSVGQYHIHSLFM